jgi:hypothetical protein
MKQKKEVDTFEFTPSRRVLVEKHTSMMIGIEICDNGLRPGLYVGREIKSNVEFEKRIQDGKSEGKNILIDIYDDETYLDFYLLVNAVNDTCVFLDYIISKKYCKIVSYDITDITHKHNGKINERKFNQTSIN